MLGEPKKNPIAEFIRKWADASPYNYEDIAIMAGFSKAHIIYLFMSGEAKVPLDRVPGLAGALGCDANQLWTLALQQFFNPSDFLKIQELSIERTPNERAWIKAIRNFSGNADPELTPERLTRLENLLLD